MTESEWPTQRVRVVPTPPEPSHFVQFKGRELGQLSAKLSAEGAVEQRDAFFTLYETPEGQKVHVVDSTYEKGSPGKTTQRLLTLEVAREQYPAEVFERLLRQEQG